MKKKIGHILKDTIQSCFDKGLLKRCPLLDYLIEIPNNPDHGHFATNLPLTLASSQKKRPAEIARVIIDNLEDDEAILEKVETAGPGFINFRVKTYEWQKFLADIVRLGERYGAIDSGSGEKVLMEFVSANPTGPLHLGHGRGAALGDTICRILSFRGYNVVREFYINDSGQQVRLLGESIFSRWKQITDPGLPFPENGYHGEYINDLAIKISEEIDLLSLETDKAIETCMELGKNRILDEIKRDLELFRVHFDVWYNESDLFSTGLVEKALKEMMARGEIYEKDGAQWIRTSAFGDDKDRVIRKNDGQYTYFTSDIAYHLEKWKRGFSKAVNIWGADHHGYVQRGGSALRASGFDDAWFSVLLIQLEKLWKEGQEIKMSKRAGQYVTLKELLDEEDVA